MNELQLKSPIKFYSSTHYQHRVIVVHIDKVCIDELSENHLEALPIDSMPCRQNPSLDLFVHQPVRRTVLLDFGQCGSFLNQLLHAHRLIEHAELCHEAKCRNERQEWTMDFWRKKRVRNLLFYDCPSEIPCIIGQSRDGFLPFRLAFSISFSHFLIRDETKVSKARKSLTR